MWSGAKTPVPGSTSTQVNAGEKIGPAEGSVMPGEELPALEERLAVQPKESTPSEDQPATPAGEPTVNGEELTTPEKETHTPEQELFVPEEESVIPEEQQHTIILDSHNPAPVQQAIVKESFDDKIDRSSWGGFQNDSGKTQGRSASVGDLPIDIVPSAKEDIHIDSRSEATVQRTSTSHAAPQPTIIRENEAKGVGHEGKGSVAEEAIQPSIAPEDLEGLQALKAATGDQGEESFQPSIEVENLLQPDSNSAPNVIDWLQSTQDNNVLMSAEDQANLAQHVLENNRDTPEPQETEHDESGGSEDQAQAHLPRRNPPINRVLQSVRTGRQRPGSNTGKRKRDDSSDAGRRTKSRFSSRDPDHRDERQTARKPLMELPRRHEFDPSRYQRLCRDNYKWGEPPAIPPLDTTGLKNHGVRIVNPMDDDEDDGDTKYQGTLGATAVVRTRLVEISPKSPPRRPTPRRPTTRRRVPRRRPTPMEVDVPEPEPEPEVTDQPLAGMFGRPPKTINNLPREILRKIVRELLISQVQIYVYAKWSKVYPASRHRNKFRIEPAILRVDQRFYWEGIRVLYGENTFVYSLRDARGPIAKAPADAEELAQDDSSTQVGEDNGSVYEDDDDNEDDLYVDEEERCRSRKRRRAKDWEGDIRVAKYFPLFRRIVIEAEHNRYGRETRQSMAKAIDFWKVGPKQEKQPATPIEPSPNEGKAGSKQTESQKSNIHTLTLRVYPAIKINDQNDHYFTFVSFFDPDSPVVESLRATTPQFTRLEINWKYLQAVNIPRPTCLIVDMRHLYIRDRVADEELDEWQDDSLMQTARKEGAKKALGALDRLCERMLAHCEKNEPEPQENEEAGLFVEEGEEEEWWADGAEGEFVE